MRFCGARAVAAGVLILLLVGAPTIGGPRTSAATAAVSATPVAVSVANLWVDVDGGSCKHSKTPIGYASATACASLNAAYQAASCGDVVIVEDGAYGNQIIRANNLISACSNGRGVTIRGQSKTGTSIQWISLGSCIGCTSADSPDNLTLEHFKIPWGFNIWGDAVNDTINDVDGGSFDLNGPSGPGGPQHITIENSDWGPCTPSGTFQGQQSDCRNFYYGDPRSGQPRIWAVDGLLVKNNWFHDMVIDYPGIHWECLWVAGGNNVTFTGNRFDNCDTNAIALGDAGSDANTSGTWIFENNWCGRVSPINGCFKFGQLPYAATMIFRSNSFVPGSRIQDEENGDAQGRVIITRNIIDAAPDCIRGAVYSQNLFLGHGTCSSTDRTGVFGYTYDGARLIADTSSAKTVQAIFANLAARKPLSPAAIARKLRIARMARPPGGWHASSIQAIASDNVYLGRRLGIPGRHYGLVTLSVWHRAQRALSR